MADFVPRNAMSLRQMLKQAESLRLPELVQLCNHPQLNLGTHNADRHNAMGALLYDWQEVFATAKGSKRNHQAWQGGLADHLAMMLRDAIPQYLWWQMRWQHNGAPAPFNLQQVALVVVLHDAEKLVKYGPKDHPLIQPYRNLHQTPPVCNGAGEEPVSWDKIKKTLIKDWANQYGFKLTRYESNALAFAHGEGLHYSPHHRVMNELAAFLHMLDVASARIGYALGKGTG